MNNEQKQCVAILSCIAIVWLGVWIFRNSVFGLLQGTDQSILAQLFCLGCVAAAWPITDIAAKASGNRLGLLMRLLLVGSPWVAFWLGPLLASGTYSSERYSEFIENKWFHGPFSWAIFVMLSVATTRRISTAEIEEPIAEAAIPRRRVQPQALPQSAGFGRRSSSPRRGA